MDLDFGWQMFFWAFVPSMATKFIQKQYYAYRRPRRTATPSEASKHYKIIYVIVVLAYLLYTIVDVERSLPATHYDYLQVDRACDAKDLRSQARQMTLMFHPDKLMTLDESERQDAEIRYLHMRQAYDVLKDPFKRSIYDKYGDKMQDCQRCLTEKDYLLKALPTVAAFYLISGGILILLSVFGTLNFGRYWRFVGLLTMGCLEFRLLTAPLPTSPSTPQPLAATILHTLLPWRTTHEHIALLHQLFVVISIAVSQLGPILWPPTATTTADRAQMLTDLDALTNMQLKESAHNFRSVFAPFARDPAAVGELQKKMEKMAVDLQLLDGNADLTIAAGQAHMRIAKRK
ncbi:hypothetical protein DFJ77DRAFT_478494 [Powellomyces hirtus]|nr:hypothetical protein DFJ77DRAFT_478494 [Powellomyces hirtus]